MLRPSVNKPRAAGDYDHEPWWYEPGQKNWNPEAQPTMVPDVDWYDRSTLVGVLYLPDGQVNEYRDEPPAFGFGRYLEESYETTEPQ